MFIYIKGDILNLDKFCSIEKLYLEVGCGTYKIKFNLPQDENCEFQYYKYGFDSAEDRDDVFKEIMKACECKVI